MAELISTEMGAPISFSNLAQAPAPWMQIEAFLGIARAYPWEETRAGSLGEVDRAPRAGRRGRGDPAVERPAVHDHVQAGPGAARRLHDRGQAGAGDPARHLPDGRAPPGGRRTRRRRQHRRRGPRGRRAPGRAPGRRQGRVHRLDRRRPQDRRGLRRAAQAGLARARRQVRRDRPRRRRPGRDHGGPEVHRADELRPGLRRADPDPRLARQLRQRRRRARRGGRGGMQVGDPMDPATEIGPMVAQRQQERVEKYIALGQEEGARVVARRQRHARRPVVGLVRPPDGLRRRRQPDADRPGGDLRPGPVGDPVRRRRRRGPDRQRLRVRPGRHGVDRRRRGRASTWPARCAPAPTA